MGDVRGHGCRIVNGEILDNLFLRWKRLLFTFQEGHKKKETLSEKIAISRDNRDIPKGNIGIWSIYTVQ